jgi:hypothetical protein
MRRRIGLLVAIAWCAGAWAQSDLPDAPVPHPAWSASLDDTPGRTGSAPPGPAPPAADAHGDPDGQQTFPPSQPPPRALRLQGLRGGYIPSPTLCAMNFCSERPPRPSCCVADSDEFAEYLRRNAIHLYTPEELAQLAARGVIDPFNLLTIVGTSAFTVATDAHTPYGPGGMGIARLSGVALTQDLTNAVVETILIPSVDHQNPLFRRMPNASLPRRFAHCLYQPFWTDSVRGKGMLNYSDVVGDMIDEAVDASYVPYQRKGWGPSADRIAVNLATTPLGNMVTEFLPDLARHINFNVVFVQRVINRVAAEESGGPAS